MRKSGSMSYRVLIFLLAIVTSAALYVSDRSNPTPEDHHQLPTDEGSGHDNHDLSDLFADASSGDVTFRCFKCAGNGEQSGCNITSLRQHPEDYLTDCSGHCLNITSGNTTVFDCTETVPINKPQCFQRGEIQMCVCGTDFCNSPPPEGTTDAIDLPDSKWGIRISAPYEADIIVSYVSKQHQNNDTSVSHDVARSAGGDRMSLCSCVLLFVHLWWGYKYWVILLYGECLELAH